MNETIRTIMERRSVRHYLPQPVEDAVLETLLNCAVHAPSGKNTQEINLTAVANPQIIEKIRLLAKEEFSRMPYNEADYRSLAVYNATHNPHYNFTFGAPVLVIASGPAAWPNGMADSALCLSNLMLAAKSLGLGSCYVNQLHWLSGNAPMRACLAGLGLPEEEEIYGSVVLGYSAETPRAAAPRREGRIRIVR